MNSNEHSKIPMMVVIFLGIIGILLSAGVLILTFFDKKIDGGLFTMAGGAIGSLGTLLADPRRQPQRSSDPDRGTDANPVAVKNAPDKPLETTPVSPDPSAPEAYAPLTPEPEPTDQ